ncbi:unnamed protein product [Protopolystoma xenopodis]|uniref:Uncharacterized protein n=1 Tax=Protopolystoma xenopodis TaxID=117903 RepID=A0A3S5AGS4_9PLAT|nr:unnamed protein product [Protopolystoma xenopodis]
MTTSTQRFEDMQPHKRQAQRAGPSIHSSTLLKMPVSEPALLSGQPLSDRLLDLRQRSLEPANIIRPGCWQAANEHKGMMETKPNGEEEKRVAGRFL